MTFRCDLSSKKVVSYDEATELADSMGVQFRETSAKNSHNVEQARLVVSCCWLFLCFFFFVILDKLEWFQTF